MKNTKILGLLAGLSVLVLLTGCKKDMVTRMNSIPITVERFNGDGKAYIDDIYACWEDGDQIKITRTGIAHYSGTISISYPNGAPVASATASGFETATGDSVYVAYPRDLFGGSTVFPIGHDMEIMLPSIYEYVTTNGKQKIVSPMVGRVTIESFESDEENPNVLRLTNLCCLLKIQLNKPSSGSFVLDSIKVINKTKTTPMSGYAQISFGSGTPVLSMGGSVNNNTVVLDLKANAVAINETKYFYVPIPPQASGQNFEVQIHNKLTGHWKTTPIYTNMTIPGNSVATISGPSTNEETEYEFFDYIQNNTSNCYINLGVVPDNTSKMEMTFEVTQPAGSQYYSGSSVAGRYLVFAISGANADSYLTNHFFDDYVSSQAANASNSILRNSGHKYRVTAEVMEDPNQAGYYYLKSTFEELDASGNTSKIVTKNSPSHEGGLIAANFSEGIPPIYVFGFNTSRKNPGMKLYSYRVWKNGNLLYNFVPAKKGTLVGVYNMGSAAGDKFIQGTGSFSLH